MAASDDMATFVAVVEHGSFAHAARVLGLTPSAVSKLISRLEQRLGTQLLARTTRRLSLTEEGETYFQRATGILEAIEEAEAEVSAGSTDLRGLIRVNAGVGFGRYQLTPILPIFQKKHPRVEIELSVTDRLINPVAEGADLVFRSGPMSDSSLVARKFMESRRYICASPEYLARHGQPQNPADLLHHNCLLYSVNKELTRWSFNGVDGVNRMRVNGDLSSDNADVLLDLALAGRGIVRLLDLFIGQYIADGRLVPILEDCVIKETTPVWWVTPPGRQRVPRVRAFIDFVVDQIKSETAA